ncbi:hypothetical protein SteCoe_37723 [Stentor coeruleus]|uniref:Uncharacterized protein n=1 Tax=Stentor coeruleus TaxID=5963 RepID=A0A1R2AMF6_9CILI|nr:hypothetical protein SteCoe_37723 [Stentor coeruleus]
MQANTPNLLSSSISYKIQLNIKIKINMNLDRLLTILCNIIEQSISKVIFEIQNAVYYILSQTTGSWSKEDIKVPLPRTTVLFDNSKKQYHSGFN